MSADNTIVILSTISKWKHKDGYSKHVPKGRVYRVAHLQAWDNFEWYEENQPYNLGFYLWMCFKDSEVYETEQEAQEQASWLYDQVGYVEYGIRVQETDYVFPGD